MQYGLIPEFIGRLPVMSAVHQLSRDDLITILTEPRNALVKQFQRFFSFDGIELVFADDALKAVADKALERETGARGLRSIIEEILLEVQFELPSRRDVKKCVVTKETVERGVKPTLVTEARRRGRRARPRSPPSGSAGRQHVAGLRVDGPASRARGVELSPRESTARRRALCEVDVLRRRRSTNSIRAPRSRPARPRSSRAHIERPDDPHDRRPSQRRSRSQSSSREVAAARAPAVRDVGLQGRAALVERDRTTRPRRDRRPGVVESWRRRRAAVLRLPASSSRRGWIEPRCARRPTTWSWDSRCTSTDERAPRAGGCTSRAGLGMRTRS